MTATTEARNTATALLPTRKRMNPSAPETAEFYDADQVAYVFRGGNPPEDRLVCATSAGHLGDEFAVGTTHALVHDQTGAKFGSFVVVGIIDFKTGNSDGEIPTKNVVHYTFR